jgi:putative ABC transport system permease protein
VTDTDGLPTRRPAGGGMPARRAVIRWAIRLFRREWRQQILALILLTVAVVGITFGVTATYNIASSSDAQFGRADQMLKLDGADTTVLDDQLVKARAWFGTIDVIGHRYVPVPGQFQPVDIRAQDPSGAYGAPMLALRQGRYPSGAGEVAVTDAMARILHVAVGATLDLDGRHRLVVGMVENPKNLSDEFVLVDPASADPAQSATVLVAGARSNVDAFRQTIGGAGSRESRPDLSRGVIAAVTLAMAAVGLLLVSLVAAAAFVVVAQRRLRQIGMLAAMGATRRHLRLVMLVNGAAIGAVAAVLGTVVGIAAWLLVADRVEVSAGHRIDRFDLPWATLAASVALAVATATAASWWPARSIARTPIMRALSVRPPTPRPAHRSALLAAALLTVGVVALVLSNGSRPVLIVSGCVITAVGVLFLGPLAIRVLAAARGGLPVAVRLALTDLVRYQARAGAALAAISLAVAIAVAIVAGSAAAQYTARQAAGLGNVSESQLLVRLVQSGGSAGPMVPVQTPAERDGVQAQVDAIAAALGSAAVTPLDMAADLSQLVEEAGQRGYQVVDIGAVAADGLPSEAFPLYVATPEILRWYGLDSTTIQANVDVLSVRPGPFQLASRAARNAELKTQSLPNLGYTSLPTSLITPAAMTRFGLQAVRAGWLVQSRHSLTPAELSRAQDLAAGVGLTIEFRQAQSSPARLQNGASGAGILLALGILATTVGLIRAEGAGDLQTLTATGAPRRIRRNLTATTAGALALLGALLGLTGAYVGLASVLHRNLGALSTPPVPQLAAIILGLPALAALAGWLLAGRAPRSFARRSLD